MLFRIVLISLALAACYAGYELWTVRNFYAFLREPEAAFTVVNSGNQTELTIVEFLNYDCLQCRKAHIVLLDYADKNKKVKLVIRPVPTETSDNYVRLVLAAGLQDRFSELDHSMTDYQGNYDEKFFRETCALYDIDYDRLVKDAQSDEVFDMAKNNAQAALSAKVAVTPAFMIGKTMYAPREDLTLQTLVRMVQAEQNK